MPRKASVAQGSRNSCLDTLWGTSPGKAHVSQLGGSITAQEDLQASAAERYDAAFDDRQGAGSVGS